MTGHEFVDGGWRESRLVLGYWLLRCSCGYSVSDRDGTEPVELQDEMDDHWAHFEGASSAD